MFAVGHMALGYLTGRIAGRLLKVKPNIFLLFLASVIPDIDLFIPGLEHRGPTHSLIILIVILIPAYLIHGKKTVPYFVALAQHSLIGDYITESTKLLWPLTQNMFGTGIEVTNFSNILLEWSIFLISMAVLLKTQDIQLLFRHHRLNLLLSAPLFAALMIIFFNFPTYVPLELLIPHLTYLTLFTLSIIIGMKAILSRFILFNK